MTAIDRARHLAGRRLEKFLDEALSKHPEDFSSVYAVALEKAPDSYVDYLDVSFSWNFQNAWAVHMARSANKALTEESKWDPAEWVWHEDCPDQCYAGVALFNGDNSTKEGGFEEDRSIQAQLMEEHQELSKMDLHILFVRDVFASVVDVFRHHKLTTSLGIADVPFQLYTPGCPNYGEHFWNVTRGWNRNAGG